MRVIKAKYVSSIMGRGVETGGSCSAELDWPEPVRCWDTLLSFIYYCLLKPDHSPAKFRDHLSFQLKIALLQGLRRAINH